MVLILIGNIIFRPSVCGDNLPLVFDLKVRVIGECRCGLRDFSSVIYEKSCP